MTSMKVLITVRNQQNRLLDARIIELPESIRSFEIPSDIIRGEMKAELFGTPGGQKAEWTELSSESLGAENGD